MKQLFNRIIDRSEHDTGYPADYLRDILASSSIGFFKTMLAMNLATHQQKAPLKLHKFAQLGAMQHEACGPCLEISKAYAIHAGVSPDSIDAALRDPSTLAADEQAAFFLGQQTAGGNAMSEELAETLKQTIGQNGYVELVVSAAAVRIFPALKRGLGYADMCALPQRGGDHVTSKRPAA